MANQSLSNKWASAGILSAIAASLCCITPVLAVLAGSSGLASTFSWMESFRPFLIGITVAVIGFAWYQKIKPQPKEEMDCNCEEEQKQPFIQGKGFLSIVTVFSALMLAFPYYSSAFYPQSNANETVLVQDQTKQTLVLNIKGMTCTGCEAHVEQAANEVVGITKAKASYEEGKAEIDFYPSLTKPEDIIAAVKTTGYEITDSKVETEKKE